MALVTPVSRHFRSRRMRLHYIDWGNAGAPPLILLHGGNDHARGWDFVAERLRDRYHVVAPDLRGHGDSDWSADGHYSVSAHILDLAELIRHETLAPATVIAHSFGARVALHHAGAFPDTIAKLVAIEGIFADPRPMLPIADRLRGYLDEQEHWLGKEPPTYPSIEAAAARMRARNGRLSEAMAHHLAHHAVREGEDGLFRWKFDPLARPRSPVDLNSQDDLDLFARIACPTLLVQGDDSPWTTTEDDPLVRAIPDARLMVFSDSGHWVQHDRIDGFADAVLDFLA